MCQIEAAQTEVNIEIGLEMEKSIVRVVLVSLPGFLQRILNATFSNKEAVEVVAIASGGLSALQAIELQHPDIVVIDANIPESEAVEIIRVIDERFPQIYNLALTETSHQMHMMTLAGSDLVMKASELQANVDEILLEVAGRLGNNQPSVSGG